MKKSMRWSLLFCTLSLFMLLLPTSALAMNQSSNREYIASSATTKQLAVPQLKKADGTKNGITLTWNKVNGAAKYRVFRKTGDSNWKSIGDVTKLSFIDVKVKEGVEYTYTVRCVSKDGKKYTSVYDKKGLTICYTGAPVLNNVVSVNNGIMVSWSKVKGASQYRVFRKTEKTNWQKMFDTSSLSYTDKTAKVGSTYSYKIRCVSKNGKIFTGDYSTVKSVKREKPVISSNLIDTKTFDEFAKESANLVKKNKGKNGSSIAAANEFYTKRLIVKSNGTKLSFDKYKPTAVICGVDNTFLVQFNSSSAAKKALGEISNLKSVVYVEPDSYGGVSAGTKVESSGTASWGVKKIGADKYAKSLSKNKKVVTVAVIDTGVSSHPFLGNRLLKNGYDLVNNDAKPTDYHGHGTHVSGIVVACTPGLNIKIMPIRVLDEDGYGYDSIIGAGIRYAADHGANVINLSLGGPHSQYIDENVQYAIKKGVTVVVAAGNEFDNTSYYCPAHIKNAVVVGAVNRNNCRAYFSNVGQSLDVVAPGVDIVSCIPGGRYASWDGTSMAAPHISAIAAMYQLAYPSYKPSQIESLIKKNTKDLGNKGWDKEYGNGIPDLSKLLTVNPSGVTLNKDKVSIEAGKTYKLVATVTPNNATNKTVTWSSSNNSVATVNGGTITAKTAGKATITVKTSNGKTATCSVTVTPKNVPATKITLNSNQITLGDEVYKLIATVSPSNATDKKVSWSSSDKNVVQVNNGVITTVGSGTAIITAKTGNGKSASCKVTVLPEPEYQLTDVNQLIQLKTRVSMHVLAIDNSKIREEHPEWIITDQNQIAELDINQNSEIDTSDILIFKQGILALKNSKVVEEHPEWIPVTVRYDLGSSIGKAPQYVERVYHQGMRITNMPSAKEEGYTFDGWYTRKTGGVRVKAGTSIAMKDHYLYAHYTKKK